MKDVIEKISSYNLFNYLFPGIVFSVLLTKMTTYNLLIDNTIMGLFIYYFIGLIISRVGSLLIEPFLLKKGFIRYASYKDFNEALEKKPKIEILSEANNMYRTLLAMFLLLFVLYGFSLLKKLWEPLNDIEIYLLAVFLLIFFLFSYRKQTNYVRKSVLYTLGKEDE